MPALEIRQLTKTYDNGVRALEGIELTVEQGDFFALLGPNGAGKSTVIGIISSLVKKTSGKVYVFGIDTDKDFRAAKSYLGLVPQELNFSQFESVEEIVLNQAGYYGISRRRSRQRAEKYLRQLGLWEKRQQRSRDLSGGMKRRLMIARALTHQPQLLILDEPTAGVDIDLRRTTWDFLHELNEQGTTIILTTHYLEEAEHLCRRIAIINRGKIIENTSTKTMLAKLHAEAFILDLDSAITHAPASDEFNFCLLDEKTLEVEIQKGQSINGMFAALSNNGVNVRSLRSKANRLEEAFINIVANDG